MRSSHLLAARLGLCLAAAVTLCLIWVPCLAPAAHAYVDPSVMTYTIQALAGVAVALSALAGVLFRRLRRTVFKTFNIDENANKAVEGEVTRIAPGDAQAQELFTKADERARRLREQSESDAEKRGLANLTWKKRFAFSLLICVFTFFIMLVAPALEIFGANTDSLVFGLPKVWWISALFNGILAVLLALLLSKLEGKVFIAFMLLVFCLGFASYIQAFFLNAGMMPADGGFIGWDDWYFVQKKIVSGIVWLLILIIPQLLFRMRPYTWLRATSALAICLIIMQAVGVGSVAINVANNSIAEKDRPYVTQGGLYTVSPKDNVIVFVLDTYDTSMLEKLREKNPNMLANFTDFTYFRNNSGAMVPTANAIPYLLSGLKPQAGQDIGKYRVERYGQSSLIPTLHNQGYSVGLYTDSAMLNYSNPGDMAIARDTINIHPMGNAPVDVISTFFVMNQCALYRQAPWVAKPIFWYYTTDINNRMMGNTTSHDGNDALYELNDAAILSNLESQGLTASDTQRKGAYRFIHLFGPHFPFSVDENGRDIGVGNSDEYRQAEGSLKVVDQYLTDLKKNGLYDQATIIVTADHGRWSEQEDPVVFPASPLMLVKPSVTAGSTGKACQISDMPVSHEDLAPTIIAAIGGDPSGYGSGQTVWQINDPNRVRYYDALTSAGDQGSRIVEYQITGNVSDIKNWKKTGNVWLGA